MISTLGSAATEVDTFSPLPALNAQEKEECLNEDDAPLPGDGSMLQDDIIDDRDVDEREHGNESSNDGPEEELVAPDINNPLGEVTLAARLHAEERTAHVDHFPGQEQGEPSQAGKCRGTSAEDNLATFALLVAVRADVCSAVAKSVDNKNERGKAERGHPETVDNHVKHKLGGENTLLEL